jgi:hypothetical protein
MIRALLHKLLRHDVSSYKELYYKGYYCSTCNLDWSKHWTV